MSIEKCYKLIAPIDRDLVALSVGTEGGATVAITFDTNNPEAVGVANIRPYSVERVLGRMGAYLIMAESVPPGEHVVIDYDPFSSNQSFGTVTFHPL